MYQNKMCDGVLASQNHPPIISIGLCIQIAKSLLIMVNVKDVIINTSSSDESGNTSEAILSWILRSIFQDLYLGQCFSTSPYDVWTKLKETYDKVNGSETFNLHHQINSLKQNGTQVSDYYHTLNGLWRQFDAITKLPACSYAPIRSSLLTRDSILDVKTAFSIISREESHRGSSSSFENKAQASVFAAKVHNNNNFKKNSSAKNPNLKWANNGNNNNQKSFSSNNSSTSITEVPTSAAPSSLITDQIQQLINMLNSKPQSNIRENMAGTLYCSNSKTFFKVYKTDKGWIIDSGANQHMMTSLDRLENVVDISDLNLQIDHPNGTTAFIKKVGNLKLSEKITLYDVLYALKIDIRGNGDSTPCDICHEAKQTKEPFPISDHKTTCLGDIVHLDVWGPYRVTSREGYKYFLTVVDDYSRAVWLYLLKGKDEVTSNVVEFFNYLKN
ncbi:ribonuclease H-like domain-containing protein [Tanacetum coccineum]